MPIPVVHSDNQVHSGKATHRNNKLKCFICLFVLSFNVPLNFFSHVWMEPHRSFKSSEHISEKGDGPYTGVIKFLIYQEFLIQDSVPA